ncbi:hypothetical protein [Nesterenkonia sp. PF2B19]|nr:hypothetical protein [Nesterenkonia sp. PF2B19]
MVVRLVGDGSQLVLDDIERPGDIAVNRLVEQVEGAEAGIGDN